MPVHSLLFSDIVDSTAIVQRLGDAAAAALWAEHDHRTQDLVERHRGREIDRSDGCFLLFDAADDAAAFASGYHAALGSLGLSARVGIHHGAVTLRANPRGAVARGAKPLEVDGLAKPLAARVMALARGGQTLLSADARAALLAVPAGCELVALGHYRAKGIGDPIELYGLVPAGHTLEPPADGDKIYRVVRTDEAAEGSWKPLRDVPHNLVPERDAFVGRTRELGRLAAEMESGGRLVTLAGVGGTGKTRLARRYARAWRGDWPGGVYFCDLSEARALDGIHFAVASALSIPLVRGDPALQIGHAISARGRCLLVLDNFEQVVKHAEATVGAWRDRAEQASFLVTSRERLQLAGEAVYALEPLDLASEAVELFEVRAKAQRAAFELDDGQRPEVVEIARMLDGLPLALELAAARVRVMSPAQIRQRLSQRFALLAGARGAAARQATLRAAIDWSWDLLHPWEQAALAQCSVFEGGFTLEAAEAVVDLGGFDGAPPVLDVVQSLVDKSLLRTWEPAVAGRLDIAEPLFGMYLTVHAYAAEKLDAAAADARPRADERHGRHFAGHGSAAALEALVRHGGSARRQALALELDNLMAASRRAVTRRDAAVAVACCCAAWEVLVLRGPVGAGATLGEQVLALPGLDDGAWLDVASCRADALFRGGRLDDCDALLAEMLRRARAAGDRRREGIATGQYANMLRDKGRLSDARPLFEAAARLARETGNPAAEAAALHNLGNTLDQLGESVASRAAHEAALALHREMGNRHGMGHVHASLGILNRHTGRLHEAVEQYEVALAIFREVGDRRSAGNTTGNMANVLEDLGRPDEQLRCLHEALEIHRQVGSRVFEGIVRANLGLVYRRQRRWDDANAMFEQALALQRESRSRINEGVVLTNLAGLAKERGRPDESRQLYFEALTCHRETSNRLYLGMTATGLGELLVDTGSAAQAIEVLEEGERHLRAIDNPTELIGLLRVKGAALHADGGTAAAIEVLADMEALLERMGAGPDSRPAACVADLRSRLG